MNHLLFFGQKLKVSLNLHFLAAFLEHTKANLLPECVPTLIVKPSLIAASFISCLKLSSSALLSNWLYSAPNHKLLLASLDHAIAFRGSNSTASTTSISCGFDWSDKHKGSSNCSVVHVAIARCLHGKYTL